MKEVGVADIENPAVTITLGGAIASQISSGLVFDPGEDQVAAATDREVTIWSIRDGTRLLTVPRSGIRHLNWSSDGRTIALRDEQTSFVELIDVRTGKSRGTLRPKTAAWDTQFIGADLALIRWQQQDWHAELWGLAPQVLRWSQRVCPSLTDVGGIVHVPLSSATTRTLAVACKDRLVVLDTADGEPRPFFPFEIANISGNWPHQRLEIAFSGNDVLLVRDSFRARAWDLETGRLKTSEPSQSAGFSSSPVTAGVSFQVLARSTDESRFLWRHTAGAVGVRSAIVNRDLCRVPNSPILAALSADGTALATLDTNDVGEIRDVDSCRVIHSQQFALGEDARPRAIQTGPRGGLLLAESCQTEDGLRVCVATDAGSMRVVGPIDEDSVVAISSPAQWIAVTRSSRVRWPAMGEPAVNMGVVEIYPVLGTSRIAMLGSLPSSEKDAAFVLTHDGRADLVGPDRREFEQLLSCQFGDYRFGWEVCEKRLFQQGVLGDVLAASLRIPGTNIEVDTKSGSAIHNHSSH